MRISDWSSDVCSSDLNYAAVDCPLCLAIGVAMHFQARANKLPEIHRRLVSIRTVMQHAIERMIRCNIPASVAASPINHERQRGDCAREQIDASPRRSEPKHASRSDRSEEHTSELQSLMRISYAVFCLQKKNKQLAHKRKHANKYTTHTN